MVEWLIAAFSGGVATVTAVKVYYTYARSWALHQLFWGVGLTLWALTGFAQAYAFAAAWQTPVYKAYYFSAVLLAGFLGAGTMGLILRGHIFVKALYGYVLALAVVMGVSLIYAPVDEARLRTALVGGLALPSSIRLIAPFINIPGGVAFIGGALYSFVKTRKLYALLITLGAATPALGGVLARFETPGLLHLTDFVGITLLSAGIFLSARGKRASPAEGVEMPPPSA